MIEVVGDLWSYEADYHCITTNGIVGRSGRAVMGRGVAHQARVRFPSCAKALGQLIQQNGNRVQFIGCWKNAPHKPINLVSFPVKHHWRDRAYLGLIELSCRQLVELIDADDAAFSTIARRTNCVVLPRPGCGSGQRSWEEVKPIVADLLDDRFHVIDLVGT